MVDPEIRHQIGKFDVQWVPLTHSIPDAFALAIRTPVAKIFHTADWKLDPAPVIGNGYQAEHYQALGEEGMMGFGEAASGLVVSGTSLATIIALKVARDQALEGVSKTGIANSHLIGYTSAQAHSCVKRAFDMLGIGSEQLRVVPCNQDFEMDLTALQQQINTDRTDGLQPFCVVGTAGAVNMGAIDDLEGIADIAETENLWFHVDGAFGATARLSKYAKDRLTGVARADSLAFDFHKWLQVNYSAGCVLFKDEQAHRKSFSDRAEYLNSKSRGLAGGDFWAVDYGPELSRGFHDQSL